MFAYEHAGIEPDLVAMAKSLGGGLPLAAVVGTAEIMDGPAPGGLGGTYGGNPLACAAALAVLDIFESEGLVAKARAPRRRAARGPARGCRRACRPSATSAASAACWRWSWSPTATTKEPDAALAQQVHRPRPRARPDSPQVRSAQERRPAAAAARHDERRGAAGAGDSG